MIATNIPLTPNHSFTERKTSSPTRSFQKDWAISKKMETNSIIGPSLLEKMDLRIFAIVARKARMEQRKKKPFIWRRCCVVHPKAPRCPHIPLKSAWGVSWQRRTRLIWGSKKLRQGSLKGSWPKFATFLKSIQITMINLQKVSFFLR